MSIFILILSLILFIFLVVIHEYGHFIFARRNGVEAEEFSIFFGPAIYKRKTKKGLLFAVRTLPLGGYVKLKGEHDSDNEPGSFGVATTWSKSKIMVGGVLFNLITAFVLFTILSWVGLPNLIGAQQFDVKGGSHVSQNEVLVQDVLPHSPAASIGISKGSQIIAIGPLGALSTVSSDADMSKLTEQYNGQLVYVKYKYDGTEYTKSVRLLSKSVVIPSLKTNNPKGYIGILLTSLSVRQYSWWAGPVESAGLILQLVKLTFIGIGHALAGAGKLIAGALTGNSVARSHGQRVASAQLVGPVGIFMILKYSSLLGIKYILTFIAYISLALAIINVLPIPAFDGGRLWLMLIWRGFKKRISSKTEDIVNIVGVFVIIALFILLTFNDAHHFL